MPRIAWLGSVAWLIAVIAAVAWSMKAQPARRNPPEVPFSQAPGTVPVVEPVTDPSRVCMVNDQDMGKPQIPIVVSGRTYYGCCSMCKLRLSQSAEFRTAVDPVTGRTVDKARAVIGRRGDGTVVYFETRENLARYAAGS